MSSAIAGGTVPPVAPARSGSKAGAIVLLIVGSLMTVFGLSVLTGGIVLASISSVQADEGYFTTPSAPFSVDTYALTSPGIEIEGYVPIPASLPFDVGTFRLQATPVDEGSDLFLGIAPRADVERYLASVRHSEVVQLDYLPFRVEYRDLSGTETPAPPDAQDFWSAWSSGPGTQEITWRPQAGDWSIVVMNADATAGVDAELVAGVHSDLLVPVAIGLIVGGSLLFIIGIALLIPGAIGLGRRAAQPQVLPATAAEVQPRAQTTITER